MSEMLYSIEKKKKHRCSGELSLHVLDIIESTMKAATTGVPQKIKTNCEKPKRFTEEEVKKILL
jgi:predicted dehydrogenase